jgi:superfamily II DNA helicase RecQ
VSLSSLQISVREHPTKGLALAELVEQVLHTVLGPLERGVIFVMTKADADEVARALSVIGVNIAKFHGDMEADVKRRVIDRYRLRGAWMVATSGFGIGISLPDIACVCCYLGAFKLPDLVQYFGRGGRRGQPYVCWLFIASDTVIPDNRDVVAWARQDGCRVVNLHGPMDEQPPVACHLLCDRQLCDYCAMVVLEFCTLMVANCVITF